MEKQVINSYYGNTDDNDYRMIPKICPLTGECVEPEHHDSDCLIFNCSDVDPNKYSILFGHRYHCKLERIRIETWHEEHLKASEIRTKLINSLEVSRKINVDEFYEYCDNLNKEMYDGRQQYSQNMLFNPYHDSKDKSLVYIFNNDEVVKITVVDNILTYLGRHINHIRKENSKCFISCCAVPGYMADAINVRLHLQHNMDVKSILHNDNPVYIKARSIAKYIDAAYGWSWLKFKKVRDRHLEMTEIVNYENIIYIKQELDEIIIREIK